MPTYEYVCKACGHELEVFQSMRDGSKRKCPKCGKSALERKIGTGAAVIFKGSGFYQTDYRSAAYNKSADADKKPAATTDAAAKTDSPAKQDEATKTESTPPSKAEPKSEPKSEPPPDAKKSTKKRASHGS